jgi:hypothetical protein
MVQYVFNGADQPLFDLGWTAVSPAGTIVICSDWFVGDTYTPPAYVAQSLKPSGLHPFMVPPLFLRSTIQDWFVGVTGGVTGDDQDGSLTGAGLRTAVDADGLGAYYTIFPPEFDAFLEWTGIELEFQTIVVYTGQYFVVLAAPDGHSQPYHATRVYRSADEGLSYQFASEIKPIGPVTGWIKYRTKYQPSNLAFATRSATPNGTDPIHFYDESPIRVEIPFPASDDVIELVEVTRVVDNVRTYTLTSDYTVNIPARTISWAPGGFEPIAGTVYRIEYIYKQYGNRPIAAVSPLNGVIYALTTPMITILGDPISPVQVVVSHDHGETWTAVGSIPVTVEANNVTPGPCLGWLDGGTGGVLIATLMDGIWRSADGGATWAHVTAPVPNGVADLFGTPLPSSIFHLPKILVLSATDALVTMDDVAVPDGFGGAWFGGRILKTTDAGSSWQQKYIQSSPAIGQQTPNANSAPNSLIRINVTEVIAISHFGYVYYSPDLGDNWQIVEPYTSHIGIFTTDTSGNGLMIDGRHALFSTSPDGGIWMNVPVSTLCGNSATRKVRRGRTVAVAEIEYLYPWEANAQDFGAGGARELILEVQARTIRGQLGEISRIHVSNPAPDMSGTTPTVVALPAALFIDWSSFHSPDLDLDHFEVRYGFSQNPLAMTSTVRRAKDQNNVFIPNLVSSLTVYIQIVPFDAFGEGIPSPIVSGVPLITLSLQA